MNNVIQFPLKKRHPVLKHIEDNEKLLHFLQNALGDAKSDSKKIWELMRKK